jgi:TolA-binding protein
MTPPPSPRPLPMRPSDPSAVIRAAAKTPWFWGAGVAVLAIAAAAAGVGAYLAGRGGEPAGEQTQAATPAPVPPPATASAPPVAVAASPIPPPATTTPQPSAGTKPAPATESAITAPKTPAKGGAVPTPVSRDSEAAQRLQVAKAKLANNLNVQALADLQQIIIEYPNTAPAAEAAFLAADVHEKTGRMDDAMAAFVEFEQRFGRDRRAVESKLRRAQILSRRDTPQAQAQARELWTEVARDHAGTAQAQIALQHKLRMETERKNLRELDPVMNVEVPAVIPTLRMIIEQFPDSPQAMAARNRLALMLEDLDRWSETAQVLEDLGARSGGNPAEVWFRLGEIYERRLKDPGKARDAYAKVPKNSPRYNDAQRRLKR